MAVSYWSFHLSAMQLTRVSIASVSESTWSAKMEEHLLPVWLLSIRSEIEL